MHGYNSRSVPSRGAKNDTLCACYFSFLAASLKARHFVPRRSVCRWGNQAVSLFQCNDAVSMATFLCYTVAPAARWQYLKIDTARKWNKPLLLHSGPKAYNLILIAFLNAPVRFHSHFIKGSWEYEMISESLQLRCGLSAGQMSTLGNETKFYEFNRSRKIFFFEVRKYTIFKVASKCFQSCNKMCPFGIVEKTDVPQFKSA